MVDWGDIREIESDLRGVKDDSDQLRSEFDSLKINLEKVLGLEVIRCEHPEEYTRSKRNWKKYPNWRKNDCKACGSLGWFYKRGE